MPAPFRRIDSRTHGRIYRLSPPLVPEPVDLDSVTTIMKGGLPTPYGLRAWRERQIAEAALRARDAYATMEDDEAVEWLLGAPTRTTGRAAKAGTLRHGVAEAVLTGKASMRNAGPIAEQVARFRDEWIADLVAVEQPVVHLTGGWGGTFDLEFVDRRGDLIIADWKTGKSVYPDAAYQLAAYAHAEAWIVGDRLDAETVTPRPARILIVHLTDDGYTVHEPERDLADLYVDFRAILRVYRAQADNRLRRITAPARPTLDEWTAHLRERCRFAAHHDPQFTGRLRDLWPDHVPTLKQGGLTADQLRAVEDVIVMLERLLDVPFGPVLGHHAELAS